MEPARSYRSLEEPANYFGCHVNVALGAILLPVAALLAFLVLDWLAALLVVLGAMGISAIVFAAGSWFGKTDPFWPDAGLVHLFDEKDYLDV